MKKIIAVLPQEARLLTSEQRASLKERLKEIVESGRLFRLIEQFVEITEKRERHAKRSFDAQPSLSVFLTHGRNGLTVQGNGGIELFQAERMCNFLSTETWLIKRCLSGVDVALEAEIANLTADYESFLRSQAKKAYDRITEQYSVPSPFTLTDEGVTALVAAYKTIDQETAQDADDGYPPDSDFDPFPDQPFPDQ